MNQQFIENVSNAFSSIFFERNVATRKLIYLVLWPLRVKNRLIFHLQFMIIYLLSVSVKRYIELLYLTYLQNGDLKIMLNFDLFVGYPDQLERLFVPKAN